MTVKQVIMSKKLFSVLFAMLTAFGASAQDIDDDGASDEQSGVSFYVGADISSAYVWRGVISYKGANFQPCLEFDAGNFALGLWNCNDFAGNLKELDIYASYTVADQLTFTLTDYYSKDENSTDPVAPYGNYYAHETGHTFEFSMDWESNFGLDASMNLLFYGADKKWWLEGTDDEDKMNKNAYGTYFELGYTADVKGVAFRPCVGAVFNQSTWYGDESGSHKGFNVVNIAVKGSRDIKITDRFSLPLYVSFGYNPQANDVWAFAGVTIGL